MKNKLKFLSLLIVAFFDAAHGTEPKAKNPPAETPAPQGSSCTICDQYPDEELIAFFERLKKVVRENDKKTIAEELIVYPFYWNKDESWHTVESPKEFIELYDIIMIPFLKEIILNFQYKEDGCLCYYLSRPLWDIGGGYIAFNRKGIKHVYLPEEREASKPTIP